MAEWSDKARSMLPPGWEIGTNETISWVGKKFTLGEDTFVVQLSSGGLGIFAQWWHPQVYSRPEFRWRILSDQQDSCLTILRPQHALDRAGIKEPAIRQECVDALRALFWAIHLPKTIIEYNPPKKVSDNAAS